MKIDADRTGRSSLRSSGRRGRGRPSRSGLLLGAVLGLVAVAAISLGLVLFGMALMRATTPHSPGMARVALKSVPERITRAARNHLAALTADDLERIHLDIKFKHLEKLRAKRREALELGSLIATNSDYVPATIRHGDRSVPTKIRLKGDALDHLRGDKWSFRVKTRNRDQLFGMRVFSIQSPAVRDHQAEPVFLEHLRREGVLTPRYRFVEVSVNGRDIGVMAVEEHFSKELLESQQRREGIIMRFDESLFWQNFALNGTFGPFANPHVALLSPFRGSKVEASPTLSGDLDAAIGLMRGFLAGELPVADVFDVDLMARFLAVCEIWRAAHPLAWHNMRFYFNPLTARLEPVGFDGNLQAAHSGRSLVAERGGLTPLLLEDEVFRTAFIDHVARIAREMTEGDFLDYAAEREREILPLIQEGFEDIPRLPLDQVRARAGRLAAISPESYAHYQAPLGDPQMSYPTPLSARLCRGCDASGLELANALPVPVEVLSIEIRARDDAPPAATPEAPWPAPLSALPLEVPATPHRGAHGRLGRPRPVELSFDPPIDPARHAVDVEVRVAGQQTRHRVEAVPYPAPRRASPLPERTLEQTLSRHTFLEPVDDDGQPMLRVRPGRWDVEGVMILPEGYGLEIEAGSALRFEADAYLLCTGPLRFRGAADRPIVLGPQPGAETWGGLAAIRTDAPHDWQHVVIESTAGIPSEGWRLTGGVTLRRAQVSIRDSVFRGNRAEDALNLIRSRFTLDGVEFHDAASDALDADFSNGTIRGGLFSRIGGDGIDVSGAEIEVEGVRLVDIADKAISVGEQSDLTATRVEIDRVGTGGASKDRSKFLFRDSRVNNASVAGVSVYTKKPEYGPAEATVENVEMTNVARVGLIQSGSRATVDGRELETIPLDAKTLY